jgi:hypothetical protein
MKMKMEEGKIYKLGTGSGDAIVKLKEIKTYPSTGMPTDYLFEYQPGSIKPIIHDEAKQLFGSEDIFPIPEGLISRIAEVYGIEEVMG